MPRVLFCSVERNCHFYGYLTGWRKYWNGGGFLRFGYFRPGKRLYAYLYVPQIGRQLCADIWLVK